VEVEVGPVVEVLDRVVRDSSGRIRYHYVIIDYLARWVAGEPRAGSDAAAVRWLHRDEWAALPLTEGLSAVLARAVALAQEAR
jgi:ADP-ribose pyrophosphatase YjhB (NUDIX family)